MQARLPDYDVVAFLQAEPAAVLFSSLPKLFQQVDSLSDV